MQAKNLLKDIPIRFIKGVGPRKSLLFERMGIKTVSDLFYFLPRRYEDRSRIVEVDDLKVGEEQAAVGIISSTSIFRARTGTVIFEITVSGKNKKMHGVWYNQPFLKKVLKTGQRVMLYGMCEHQGRLFMTHPAFEIIEEEKEEKSLDIGRIVPIYPLTEGLAERYLRKVVYTALHLYAKSVQEILPTAIRARRRLVDSRFAIENIHFPYSFENLERSYRRLVFEEFFMLQMVMAFKRKGLKEQNIKPRVKQGVFPEFEKLFDFEFTEEQKKCINEINSDMTSPRPMHRLLQGDVGSGKTVVAMYALFLCVRGGSQAAFMSPTEILARQHYVTLSKVFMPLGINVQLLVGAIDEKSKVRIRKELAQGEIDIIIGTHSLIQEGVDFKKLGLIVIDEQHKFGVTQREKLRSKQDVPDTLIMTATPIPRSLALMLFGDMDISFLKEKPAGLKEVATYWVTEHEREVVYNFIQSEIKEGRQAFIVYPRIKKTSSSELKASEEMYLHLKEKVFPGLRLALIHGRIKSDEKERIMQNFYNGKIDILIATTIVEVGLDIPNVSIMLIEHAERYGLAQLHQLRGRIGRGRHESFCILMGEPKTDASHERLSIMAETSDGFIVSEKDLSIRGPGDLLGTRQSGLPELKFGSLTKDFKIMEEAREEAFRLVRENPELARHLVKCHSVKESECQSKF